MRIVLGRWFEVDLTYGLLLRLPFAGQGHYNKVTGWTWDRWTALRETGEA
jgi:hypothetical protein